jgi:hypothetical protein
MHNSVLSPPPGLFSLASENMVLDRKYDIEKNRSGASLVCSYCGQRMSVGLFSKLQGNQRTQAAAAMNLHINEAHWPQLVSEHRAKLQQEPLHPNFVLRAEAR